MVAKATLFPGMVVIKASHEPPLGRRGSRPSAPSDQRTVSTYISAPSAPKPMDMMVQG